MCEVCDQSVAGLVGDLFVGGVLLAAVVCGESEFESESAFLSSGGMIGGIGLDFGLLFAGIVSSLLSLPLPALPTSAIFPLTLLSPALIPAPYSSTISAALP